MPGSLQFTTTESDFKGILEFLSDSPTWASLVHAAVITWKAVDVIEDVEDDQGYLLWWAASSRFPIPNNAKGLTYGWIDPTASSCIAAIGPSSCSKHARRRCNNAS
jgi:hypothetical protein